jgi:stringent starvation protein A
MKRSVMALYSGAEDIYSHQVRIVLAEKAVTVDIVEISDEHPNRELMEYNPYNSVPTLVDRDLILYQPNVIMEYLDERFPHPPLLPVYPVARAKSRLMMYRIERDWYAMYAKMIGSDPIAAANARKELTDSLLSLLPVFSEMPYFLSEEFSMVDCTLAPLLWRLPRLQIKLPKRAKPIFDYMDRLFARETFQASLSEQERDMRDNDDF